MTKFRNNSADDQMIAIDAGKRASNGEPFCWWKVMHPGQVFEIKNEAIRGASVNPNLRMVTEEADDPIKEVETQVKTGEPPKRRGRPPILKI